MNDLPTSPPLLTTVAARRSLRAFAPDPVPDDELALLFEAARWAPSSGNGQPWRFVVTRRGSEPHARLAATLRSGNAWATAAPLLVLAVVKTVHDSPGKPVRANRRALLDLGLAVQNLLLQATHQGLTTHPMAGFDAHEAAKAVQVDGPYEVAILLAIGYPGDPATLAPEVRAKDERARRRLAQREFVFEGVWDEPASWARDDAGGRDGEDDAA